MMQWKNIATVVALSVTAALAGTGCMAQGADDEATDDAPVATATPDQETQGATASDEKADEKTGDAHQACFGGGCGGFGGWGGGFGGFGGWGGGFGGWGGGFGGWGGGFGGWGGFGGLGCGCGCAIPIVSAFAVPVVSTAIIPVGGCCGGCGCGC
jgi:hypothetical protein